MAMTYPALFDAADSASNRAQRIYLRTINAEYCTLFLAAVFSMSTFESVLFYYIYAFLFVIASSLLIFRFWRTPEQTWYRCRALAESVKTTTWRYAMRAQPFDDNNEANDRADFAGRLSQILSYNSFMGSDLAGLNTDGEQITPEMRRLRSLSLHDRKATYLEQRIGEQRSWYAKKAKFNKRSQTKWVLLSLLVYAVAFSLVIARLNTPEWNIWPIEPLIVLSTSIIGWIQIKKFGELASSYTLTAHEIGLIREKYIESASDDEFSIFVNEAELAFSREHTQWVARQYQG
jgi:hypothetical protein